MRGAFTIEAITKPATCMRLQMFKMGDRSVFTGSDGYHPSMTFRAALVPVGARKRIVMTY